MDYKQTAKKEVAELKSLISDLHNVNDAHDNVRDLEADHIIQAAMHHTHKLVTVDGKVLHDFFFENGVDHHDLYNVNHGELTKDRIHDMLTDTIDAVEGKTVVK